MSFLVDTDHGAYARIIGDALDGVAEELRSIDIIDLITHIRCSQYAAIEDLLQSSTELFFKDGTLCFAWTASVAADRGNVPTVTLGMEFTHLSVSVFFDLALRGFDQVVTVAGILFDPACDNRLERLKRLSRALADARLVRHAGPLPADPRA